MPRRSAEEKKRLTRLLSRISGKDQLALAELYDETSPILYGLLLKMLRRPEAAQEALQDTYLRVWQRSETYSEDRGDPIGWLIGVARYRALDMLRSPAFKNYSVNQDLIDASNIESEDQTPEDSAVQQEGLRKLMKCLGHLSEVQRKSVLLAYYQGYSHLELSQAMKAPLGTVKAWVRRGLRLLRECLER